MSKNGEIREDVPLSPPLPVRIVLFWRRRYEIFRKKNPSARNIRAEGERKQVPKSAEEERQGREKENIVAFGCAAFGKNRGAGGNLSLALPD